MGRDNQTTTSNWWNNRWPFFFLFFLHKRMREFFDEMGPRKDARYGVSWRGENWSSDIPWRSLCPHFEYQIKDEIVEPAGNSISKCSHRHSTQSQSKPIGASCPINKHWEINHNIKLSIRTIRTIRMATKSIWIFSYPPHWAFDLIWFFYETVSLEREMCGILSLKTQWHVGDYPISFVIEYDAINELRDQPSVFRVIPSTWWPWSLPIDDNSFPPLNT